jgi:hypothetical protein
MIQGFYWISSSDIWQQKGRVYILAKAYHLLGHLEMTIIAISLGHRLMSKGMVEKKKCREVGKGGGMSWLASAQGTVGAECGGHGGGGQELFEIAQYHRQSMQRQANPLPLCGTLWHVFRAGAQSKSASTKIGLHATAAERVAGRSSVTFQLLEPVQYIASQNDRARQKTLQTRRPPIRPIFPPLQRTKACSAAMTQRCRTASVPHMPLHMPSRRSRHRRPRPCLTALTPSTY